MARTFKYQAKNSQGKVVQGTLTAGSENEAFQQLSQKSYFPLSIEETRPGKQVKVKKKFSLPSRWVSSKVTARQLSDMFDHFSILLASGFPVLKCLQLIQRQVQNPVLSNAMDQITRDIQGGTKLSESVAEFPTVFPPTVVGAIQAGEASGKLDFVFKELARTFESEAELRSKVTQTLVYPTFVAGFGILTVIFIMTFIIPKLTVLFDTWEQRLPLPTQIMLGLSSLFTHGFGAALILMVMVGIFYWRRLKREDKVAIISRLTSSIPFVRKLLFLYDFVPLTRTWGLLLKSGVPLLESIKIAQSVVASNQFKRSLKEVSLKVMQGQLLSDTLTEAKLFPDLAINFVQVGEETGGLDVAFERIATFYDRELNQKLKVITALLEPILILIVGLGICFIVLSLLLPIFEINLLAQ